MSTDAEFVTYSAEELRAACEHFIGADLSTDDGLLVVYIQPAVFSAWLDEITRGPQAEILRAAIHDLQTKQQLVFTPKE